MENVKFSLIVPVYNVERYVARCVHSLFAQTYADFEVICVDDGSTDSSPEVLRQLAAQYPAMRVITQENKGLGGARNTGVAHATGDYLWFIDSDDWIEPDSLASLAQVITERKQPPIVLFDVNTTDGAVKQLMPNLHVDSDVLSVETYVRALLLHQAHYFAWGKVFRRDSYEASGFSFPKGFYEDVALLPYYARMTDTVHYLHKPLYNYYVRTGSIMNTYDLRVLNIYGIYHQLLQAFGGPEWRQELAHFFYVVSIKRRKMLPRIPDKTARTSFWRHYDHYQQRWSYYSGDCLLNPYLSWKEKLQVIRYFIITRH